MKSKIFEISKPKLKNTFYRPAGHSTLVGCVLSFLWADVRTLIRIVTEMIPVDLHL